MRRLLVAAGLLALVFGPGCTPARPQRDEVVFWTSQSPAALAPLVRGFERENPTLEVRLVARAAAEAPDSLVAALAAGRPPDLCEVDAEHMPALLGSGALCDWSAGVAAG